MSTVFSIGSNRCCHISNGLKHLRLIFSTVSKTFFFLSWNQLSYSGIPYFRFKIFVGASSIGTSINPQFIASFASAAGKRCNQDLDSEESDPEVNFNCLLKHPLF